MFGWIFNKAGQFFDYYGTLDAERITITSVHFGLGHCSLVPNDAEGVNVFQSWNDFTKALETEFGPSLFDCPRSKLFKLIQTNTVAEYYLKFNWWFGL